MRLRYTTRRRRKISRPALVITGVLIVAILGLTAMVAQSSHSAPRNENLEMPGVPPPPPPFTADELAWFDDSFTEFLLRRRFNGTILVARSGVILYQRAFGFADFRQRIPLQQETPFQLASISKTFTAAAVLMLQEDGLLDIDHPVDRYIEGFPYPQMTIRHLLNHTSGIQNYMYLVERHWKQERPPTNEDVLNLFKRYPGGVNFRAGTRFAYSNTGYAFLSLLIERVSGRGYEAFLNERIFQPLNMTHTFVYKPGNNPEVPQERALGFRQGRRSMIQNTDVVHDAVTGDKGIYSNIFDLYTWDQSIYDEILLPAQVWEEAFMPATLENTRTVNYGHGWRLQSFLDKRIVHHPGRWNGFRTSFKRFIDDQATLIVLTNNNTNIAPLVDGLQEILFHKDILLMAEKPEEEEEAPYEEGLHGQEEEQYLELGSPSVD